MEQGQFGKAIWPIVDHRKEAGEKLYEWSREVPPPWSPGSSTRAPGAGIAWGGLDHQYLRETGEPVLAAASFAAR